VTATDRADLGAGLWSQQYEGMLRIRTMVRVSLEAAEQLAAEGIAAEVVDPRTLSPLDTGALTASVKKTGRAVVVDEGYQQYRMTAELAAVIAEGAFVHLDAPVQRLGAMDVPIPFSPVLEDLTVPTAERVASVARTLVRR
jgi:pyruvate/2-oxoglutarate/acetoin dehydrogenase E1 component